jgi:hypothetical protein
MRIQLSRIFSKEGPTVGRWTTLWTSILLANFAHDLAKCQESHDMAGFVVFLAFSVLMALMWPILTIRRLVELSLSWMWVIPLVILYAVALVAAVRGQPLLVTPTADVAVLAQIPLVFLSPRKEQAAVTDQGQGEPVP